MKPKDLGFVLVAAMVSFSSLLISERLVQALDCERKIGSEVGGYQLCKVRQTASTEFICEDKDQNDSPIPTLFVYTRRFAVPVISWRSGYEPKKRCRNASVRFQQAFNCEVLHKIKLKYSSRQGGTVYVPINEATRGKCPALDPNRKGKFELFTLEPGMNPACIKRRLADIRVGVQVPLSNSETDVQSEDCDLP